MILRKPIQWGSYEVRIIFLLAVEKMESRAVKPFFDWMTNLSNNVDQLSALIESKTYQEFISKMF
jgi:lichenan operon transcriptional antiterminator